MWMLPHPHLSRTRLNDRQESEWFITTGFLAFRSGLMTLTAGQLEQIEGGWSQSGTVDRDQSEGFGKA